jgi:hypothetical protein
MIMSSLNSALQGMQSASTQFLSSARKIAASGSPSGQAQDPDSSLEMAMVGLKSGQFLYEANMHVARTADEMLGTLIDTLA